jgi:hypothetical protein
MNDAHFKEAEKLFDRAVPAPTVSDYEEEQQAFRANFERLKAERQAREERCPGYSQLRTYRCTALIDAMCHQETRAAQQIQEISTCYAAPPTLLSISLRSVSNQSAWSEALPRHSQTPDAWFPDRRRQ